MPKLNHLDTVRACYLDNPPEHTVQDVLHYTLRIILALPPEEEAGLLFKEAGENIARFGNFPVSAGRICYPDGQLYKVAMNIPQGNEPEWLDDGFVDRGRYIRVVETPEEGIPPPPPPPPLPPIPPPFDVKAYVDEQREFLRLQLSQQMTADKNEILASIQKQRDDVSTFIRRYGPMIQRFLGF